MSIRNIDRLLSPRSVAVIGASDRAGSVGATVWKNLHAGRFSGPLMPVNLKRGLLGGVPVVATVQELAAVPDLAVLCTPPDTLIGLIESLGRLGTRAAIVMTTGLTARQTQGVLDAARPHLLRVLGPNCLGLMSPRIGLNASFAHTQALPGDLAFVSQSGALLTAVLDWTRSRGIGFSHLVSLGERADVDFGDLLDYLASDAHTRAILLYMEAAEAPRKFMSAARAAARNKPVIIVKAGRAGKGLQAAASHTGALAGADDVIDAAIRRAGMLRVDTLQDLFMAAETLAHFRGSRASQGAGLTVMTNGGGAGVMAADAAAIAGVLLPELSAALRRQLDATLPPTWSRGNPVDIIGDAPVERYTQTLAALLADPQAGTVLFIHAPTAIVASADIARACAPIAGSASGRVMAAWLGADGVAQARAIFEQAGIAAYDTPEQAVRAFSMLETYRANQTLLAEAPASSELQAPDRETARAVIGAAMAAGRLMLDALEARAVLKAYGVPVVAAVAARASADAVVDAAHGMGFPVALKILSPDISHKSDVGGVMLDLADEPALRQAVATMRACVRDRRPQARMAGFMVERMVRRPFAQELIVGASTDPVFGPVILFGQGGTAVEVVADHTIGLPPLNRVLARDMVSRTRVARLLAGYRQHPPAQLEAILDVLVAVSQMLADLPELVELDINPLWADADGVTALDVRIRLAPARDPGTARFAIQPYPAQLEETLRWQGQDILVRPIRPEDETQHRAFTAELSPEDLRLRFFHARRELPRTELARLVQIDYEREMAFVALAPQADGRTRTLGVARAVTDPDNVEAEFAIILRGDAQGQGLGRLLLDKMIRYLAGRGTRRMSALVLRQNTTMRELAAGSGFQIDRAESDDDCLRFVLTLDPLPSSTAER